MVDPVASVRALFAVFRLLMEANAKIAKLEEENMTAWCRVGELEERLHSAELRLAEWEGAADVVGPVGRPL